VEVRTGDLNLGEIDDGLLDDMEAVLGLAAAHLCGNGFVQAQALETGTSALYVRRLPNDPDQERAVRREAIGAALALWKGLRRRPTPDPRVHVGLVLHTGDARFFGPNIDGGELLQVETWAAENDGVFGTEEVFRDLPVDIEPAPPLLRVIV
jgi:hypothetical protein